MDVMALHQGGIATAVAPLGTSFTPEQATMLRRYADTCHILFDSDDAGQNAAEKAVILCTREGLESYVVSIKEAKDPAEILQKEGAEALQRSVKLYINSFDYLADRAVSRHDAASPEGKHRIVTDLNAFLEAQDSEVKRDGYLRRLSDMLEVNVTAISADLSQPPRDAQAGPVAPQDPERIDSDLFLMLGAAAFPEYFTIIRQYLKADDLRDQRARNLYILLEDAFRRDELEMNLVVQKVDNEHIRALILDKALSGELGPDPKEVLQDVLRRVRYDALERRQLLVARELKKAERENLPHHELKELLSEKMYLTEELRKLRVKQG
jgi:DNA primase